jgi:chromate transporter
MNKNIKFYLKLFTSTFYLSTFTFGGGYVIVPLMREKFVSEYHWIDETEMIDLTAIAQSTPGAIAVNAAILVGYRLAGYFGSIITIIATVLPPLIILSLISVAYTAFINNLFIKYILRGMQAGVAAIIIDVAISMIISLAKEGKVLPVIMLIGAFTATFIFKINVVIIILVSGLIGAVSMYYPKYAKKRGGIE